MKVVRIKLSTSDSPVPQLVLAHETVPTSIPTSPPQTTPVASSSSMKPNNVIASDAFEDVTDPTVTVSTKSRSSATGSSSTKSSVTDVLSPRPLFTISNPSPDSQSSQAPEAGPTFTQEHLTSIIKQPIFTIPSSLTSLHGPRAAHIPAVTTVRALPSDNVPQLAAPVASLNPDDTGQSSKTNPVGKLQNDLWPRRADNIISMIDPKLSQHSVSERVFQTEEVSHESSCPGQKCRDPVCLQQVFRN